MVVSIALFIGHSFEFGSLLLSELFESQFLFLSRLLAKLLLVFIVGSGKTPLLVGGDESDLTRNINKSIKT